MLGVMLLFTVLWKVTEEKQLVIIVSLKQSMCIYLKDKSMHLTRIMFTKTFRIMG